MESQLKGAPYKPTFPAWLELGPPDPAAGGNKARNRGGSKQSAVSAVCLQDAEISLSSFQLVL